MKRRASSASERVLHGEDDKVGSVDNLLLAPREGEEFLALGRVFHDKELPRAGGRMRTGRGQSVCSRTDARFRVDLLSVGSNCAGGA